MLNSENDNIEQDLKINKDYIFPKAVLGNFVIHMKKMTSAKKGSAPIIEIELNSKTEWKLCKNTSWGKKNKTYKYFEEAVKGSKIVFNITNELDDITYYKIEGFHPYQISIYDRKKEAKFLKRFVFFKFSATAAKHMNLFKRIINNDLYALDTKTKLLYAYSVPADYEKMIGNNYIPLHWEPYEYSKKTKDKGLRFYEYDPIGFVSKEENCVFFNVKTNIHLYDWWLKSINAGKNIKDVRAMRFMPRISEDAEDDWTIRDDKIPVKSPYRKKYLLNNNSQN